MLFEYTPSWAREELWALFPVPLLRADWSFLMSIGSMVLGVGRARAAAALVLTTSSFQARPSTVSTVVFEVIHIYDSPHVWTGLVEFDQPIDVAVVRSSSAKFRSGQRLTIRIPVDYSSELFDHETASLSPAKITTGSLFRARDRHGCFYPPHLTELYDDGVLRRSESRGFILDASCITPLNPPEKHRTPVAL
jgi:hypothetical protein